ncbi:PREDICTED: inter-alpha-trypsin inhibitor heavy chain H4-like, partial [Thamnophis sirtalis]|uniref:Inter-alpha-trypsin inhibitor heavy chain H4-like n=1 Tax=Thamnophis sirtalis TaxID=35019 RepID=A0A6I9YXX8_9SAUR
ITASVNRICEDKASQRVNSCFSILEIYSLHIDCKVMSRYAHTVITSRIVNRANESKEALFDVELPKKAFITNFSMTIDGETYPGIIREKKAAQAQYDSAISRGQSAGLVKSTGRKLEKFSVSVNVAAAGKVNFELNYEQLLDRKLGNYELIIKVKPKQLVKDFQIDTHIFEPQGISFLAIEGSFLNNEISDALVKTQEETKAHILFKPTLSQQRKNPESEQTLLDGDFIIRYDVKRNVDVGDIQIVNGYFVHYFAPSDMPVFPKNIIFVIDKSGSMSGNKIRQTKEALEKILEDLNPKDHFNLIVFSRGTSKWKPTLVQASKENVESAKQYVKTIDAQGGTNINEALLTAIDSLDKATYGELLPERSISTIILLTDGQPTSGETNPKKIQKNINNANEEKYFLYCLGFGFDVSYSFLEKLALDNSGVARRIYEDSDAALQLQDFYSEVAIPILKEININYLGNAVEDVTENNFKLLYEGSEIVVAGKLDNEIDIFSLEIKAQGHGSNLTLKEDANVTEKAQVFEHQEYIFGNFIEKLWAYLTIQQLLEKSILAEKAEQKTLENQALNLSLKYSFVTPMTSMVVTKPEAEEVANKPTEEDNEDFQGNFRGHAGSSYALPHSFPVASRMQAHFPDTSVRIQKVLPGIFVILSLIKITIQCISLLMLLCVVLRRGLPVSSSLVCNKIKNVIPVRSLPFSSFSMFYLFYLYYFPFPPNRSSSSSSASPSPATVNPFQVNQPQPLTLNQMRASPILGGSLSFNAGPEPGALPSVAPVALAPLPAAGPVVSLTRMGPGVSVGLMGPVAQPLHHPGMPPSVSQPANGSNPFLL